MKKTDTKKKTKQKSVEDRPVLLVADQRGEIYDEPRYVAGGMSGGDFLPLSADDLIPLPEGSKFFFVPKGRPIGFDKKGGAVVVDGAYAVSAFLPPGYTRTYLPAYEEFQPDPLLPLWSYTAVAWYKGAFYAAALQVAWMKKADPRLHDDDMIAPLVKKKLAAYPKNRLLKHLEKCAMFYHCFAAKNIFVGRWEAPLPSSPSCNARCIGCLSLQEGECPSSQDRIQFVPAPEEIAEAAVPHLEKAEDAIVSFGQGCEGEPLLQTKILVKAVKRMRDATPRGVVNLNTNGFSPDRIKTMHDAGLDSIRISMNSADRQRYHEYYRPKGYTFEDVMDSVKTAKKIGLFTSINYLVFPGYTDSEEEVEKLKTLIADTGIDQVQMRNLSLDPSLYLNAVQRPKGRAVGVRNLVGMLKEEFPSLVIGYFNLPATDIKTIRKKAAQRKS
ncbi:MAG TPA: radical SAM protein [Nitrospirota bacterium]|nr:radical SAM protein [Nitrospirota bacterium]